MGGSVTKVVSSFLTDIINPFLGLILGSTRGLENAYIPFFKAKIMYGHFLSVLIDFFVIAFIVYFGVKGLGLDKLDRKNEKK